MPSSFSRLREAFSRMSPFGKLSVAASVTLAATLLFAAGYLSGAAAAGCGR